MPITPEVTIPLGPTASFDIVGIVGIEKSIIIFQSKLISEKFIYGKHSPLFRSIAKVVPVIS